MTQVSSYTDAQYRQAIEDTRRITGAEYFGCFFFEEFVGHRFSFDVLESKARRQFDVEEVFEYGWATSSPHREKEDQLVVCLDDFL